MHASVQPLPFGRTLTFRLGCHFALFRNRPQLGFSSGQIEAMVAATGPREDAGHGFTYSDLKQRLLPAIVLDAYPEQGVNPDAALGIARNMMPTAPFQDGGT